MLNGLFLASLVSNCYNGIKDAFVKPIPEGSFANRDLIIKDLAEGKGKDLNKYARQGRYVVHKNNVEPENYKKPHRDPVNGKIIIENNLLYDEDCRKYGCLQARKWMRQGKYNLEPEEFEKELERIRNKYNYK